MDYGFATFHPYEAVQAGKPFGEIRITDSPTAQMEAILAEGYTALFSDAEIEKLHLTADLPKELAAPVHRGERLGQAVLWLGEERICLRQRMQNRSPLGNGCFALRRGGSAGEIRETFDFLRGLMYTEENRMKNTG